MNIKEMLLDYNTVEAALDILDIEYNTSKRVSSMINYVININNTNKYKSIIKEYNIDYHKTVHNCRIIKYNAPEVLYFFVA